MKKTQIDGEIKFEVTMEGKVAVRFGDLKGSGHLLRKNVLLVVKEGVISVYNIEKPLTERERKSLDKNFKYAMKCIKNKLREGGPIMVTDGDVYYDDMALIKAEDGIAYIAIF